MLHIILGILKVIGIMTGLLLCIFFGIVFFLLFVPVRYRVGAVKQEGKQQLNICLSWLLRMISVAVSGGQREKPAVTIRLFGFRLPFFKEETPEDEPKNKKRSGRQNQKEHAKERTMKKAGPEREKEPPPGERELLEEKEEVRQKEETVFPGKVPKTGQSEPAAEPEEAVKAEPEEADKKEAGQEEDAESQDRKRRKIRQTLPDLKKRAAAFIKKVRAFGKKLFELRKKPAQIKKAFERLCEKPSLFLRMIEEYEIKEVSGNLMGEVLYLLSHYKPRRIRGYLRFGAGDPALTGILTGVIYLFLPARAEQFAVMPDFYETVFETEAIFTGYIRSVHLIRTALYLVRDKKLRRAFRGFHSHQSH